MKDTVIQKILEYHSDNEILSYLTLSLKISEIMNLYFINKIKKEHKYLDISQLEEEFAIDNFSIYKLYIRLTINKKCILCSNRLCYTAEDKHRISAGISSPVCSICVRKYITNSPNFLRMRKMMNLINKEKIHLLHNIPYSLENYNIKFHSQLNVCIYRDSYLDILLFMKCLVCKKIVTTKNSLDTCNLINFYNNIRIAYSEIDPTYSDCIKKYLEENCLIKYSPHLNYKGIGFRKKTCVLTSGHIESQHSLIHTCCIGKYTLAHRPLVRLIHSKINSSESSHGPTGSRKVTYVKKKTLSRIERFILNVEYNTEFPIVLYNDQLSIIKDYKKLPIFIGGCSACTAKSGICTCASKNKNINVFWGKKEDYPNYEIFNQYILDYPDIELTSPRDYEDISERIQNPDLMRKFIIFSTQTIFLHDEYY
jgi:hypothetical protein